MSDADELIAALQPVTEAFRSLGIRHYVGGSVASSFHGAIRFTMDVDLVCELPLADLSLPPPRNHIAGSSPGGYRISPRNGS